MGEPRFIEPPPGYGGDSLPAVYVRPADDLTEKADLGTARQRVNVISLHTPWRSWKPTLPAL